MQTIGILGGMSWHSTAIYYAVINQTIATRLGDLNSARLTINSINFAELITFLQSKQWSKAITMLASEVQGLEKSGADFFLIASNTIHKFANEIQDHVKIPIFHIGEAVGNELRTKGVKSVGFLGTRFTMQGDFVRGFLLNQFGINCLIPEIGDQRALDEIIYKELANGIVKSESKTYYETVMKKLLDRGAEGIILGCTEIGLLFPGGSSNFITFDSAEIHARAAALKAIGEYHH